MGATIDSGSYKTTSTFGDTTLNFDGDNFTIAANSNRAIVGCLSVFDDVTVSACTLAGQTATQVTNGNLLWNVGGARLILYYAVAPSTGSQTASITWAPSAAASFGIIAAYNVDQTTPVINGTSVDEASPADLAITADADDLTFSLASNSNVTTTHTCNQTVVTTDFGKVAVGTAAGGATHTWTQASTEIGVVGAAFKAFAASSDPEGSLVGGKLIGGGLLIKGVLVP